MAKHPERSSHSSHTPQPDPAARGRQTTSKRGGSVDPHDATANFRGPRRGKWPQDNPPTPEATKGRESGSSQSNDLRHADRQDRIATRESGQSRTMQNPLR